ncbi:MAG: LysR family transcriptional regulator [Clostridiales bacterium]|nr:LysR family transcriptional regulator [Clostridiales bacterium]
MCISQSSLSKHINTLEKELGIKLFDRTSRKVALSEAGEKILPFTKQVCEIRNSINSITEEYSQRNRKELVIASIPVMAQYDITGVITRFQKEYPEISLLVSEHEQSEISALLEAGECELAFVRKTPEEDKLFDYAPLCIDRLVAVLPLTHGLSGKKSLQLLQLKEEEFLFLDKKTSLYKTCFDLCSRSGFIPKVKYTGHRPENIIDLVSKGMGVSLLMKRHVDYYKNDGIVCLEIKPTIDSLICLAKTKDHSLSSKARIFWNYIKALNISLMDNNT